MSKTVTVITPAHRAAAIIRKGQRAWTAIKGTAEEQRFWWMDVGLALAEGKDKANRGGLKFSDWCQEKFPGLDTKDYVPAAQWYATVFPNDSENRIPAGMADPVCIRRWFNEQQANKALPEDAPKVKVEQAAKFETQRDAEKFIKTYQRAQSGDEGADTAKRMSEAVAKKHGTTAEALFKTASQQAPDMAHRFPPALQLSIDRMRSTLRDSAAAMERSGISKDAIRDIFVQFTNSL